MRTRIRSSARRARMVLVAVPVASLAWAGSTLAGAAGEPADPGLAGTCVASPSLPCSASGGQTYGTVLLNASDNDDEASVEAVLGQVVGSAADVTALARGQPETAPSST